MDANMLILKEYISVGMKKLPHALTGTNPNLLHLLFSWKYVTPLIYFAKTVALKHLTILFNLLYCSLCFSQTNRAYSYVLISLFTESL